MLTLCPQQQTFKGSHTLSLLAFGFSDLLRTRAESTLPVSEQHRMRLFSGDWLLTATPKNSCPSHPKPMWIRSPVGFACFSWGGIYIYCLVSQNCFSYAALLYQVIPHHLKFLKGRTACQCKVWKAPTCTAGSEGAQRKLRTGEAHLQ